MMALHVVRGTREEEGVESSEVLEIEGCCLRHSAWHVRLVKVLVCIDHTLVLAARGVALTALAVFRRSVSRPRPSGSFSVAAWPTPTAHAAEPDQRSAHRGPCTQKVYHSKNRRPSQTRKSISPESGLICETATGPTPDGTRTSPRAGVRHGPSCAAHTVGTASERPYDACRVRWCSPPGRVTSL